MKWKQVGTIVPSISISFLSLFFMMQSTFFLTSFVLFCLFFFSFYSLHNFCSFYQIQIKKKYVNILWFRIHLQLSKPVPVYCLFFGIRIFGIRIWIINFKHLEVTKKKTHTHAAKKLFFRERKWNRIIGLQNFVCWTFSVET